MGKHAKPEEIVAKLRQFEVLTAQGKSIAEAARSIGVSEQTYYRWRAEFGSMKSDQVKRLKALELENTRLRRGNYPPPCGRWGSLIQAADGANRS